MQGEVEETVVEFLTYGIALENKSFLELEKVSVLLLFYTT